jgi:signal transduction histidine kinase
MLIRTYFRDTSFFKTSSFNVVVMRCLPCLWAFYQCLPAVQAQMVQAHEAATLPSATVVSSQTRTVSLVSSTEYVRDPSHTLFIADVAQPSYSSAFQRKSSEALVFGWTSDAVWLRTSLRAAKGADTLSWVLDVGFMSLDSVSLFVPMGARAWHELRSGSSVPFAKRSERYARVLFPLALPPHDSALTVYLRVTSSNSIYLNMNLVERKTLESRLEAHDFLIVWLFGMMVSALLYNAVMFVSMRDTLYGYYIFYAASVICSYTIIHGLAIKYFFPMAAQYASSVLTVSLFLTYIGALLFSKEFLATKTFAPRFERFMVYVAIVFGVCIVPIVVMPSVGWIIPIASTVGNIVMLLAAILSVRKGYFLAWFYLIAWLMFFFGTTYFGAVSSGLIVADTTPVFTILTASTTFELTMFSFILAYRFRRLRDDAQAAERERQFAERERELEHRKNMELHAEKSKTEDLNARLQASNNEKSEILGIVAHDLQNPLTSILLSGEILTNLVETQHFERIPHIVDNVNAVATRMLEIVRNLLNVNLLESGALRLRQETFDIAPLLLYAVDQYVASARTKNITLHLHTEEASSTVCADSQAFARVVDNLISNAVKYSPLGKNVYIRLKPSNEAVRVEVQDEGEGIAPDDMKKLFVKFSRLSARPTGGEHSTGLGLSIVKKMIEAMNGRVWCESELGKGATFIVELPSVSA